MKKHPKIEDLKRRSSPINYTRASVDAAGKLVDFNVAIEDRTVKGYLSVWGIKDTYDTIMVKGCCTKSINERGPDAASKQKIAHLWQHESCEPIAKYTVLKEDDYGLYFEAEYDDIPQAERALRQIRSGTLNQFSIGFNYVYDKVEYDEINDALIIKEIELFEGSVVTFGANDETYAMRSPEQLDTDIDLMQQHSDEFIKLVPKHLQLELRQLFTRYKTLYSFKPAEIRKPLDKTEPEEVLVSVGGYKIDLTQLKKS